MKAFIVEVPEGFDEAFLAQAHGWKAALGLDVKISEIGGGTATASHFAIPTRLVEEIASEDRISPMDRRRSGATITIVGDADSIHSIMDDFFNIRSTTPF